MEVEELVLEVLVLVELVEREVEVLEDVEEEVEVVVCCSSRILLTPSSWRM